jgi:hypothetical protein
VPRTDCVCSRVFDCVFEWLAVFRVDESTRLPLFWSTSPPRPPPHG